MASAAEQLASSINFSAFSKATELKSRIWFTLGALVIYRLGTYIPIPGIDPGILHDIFSRNSGGILGMFDMFSGGALGRLVGGDRCRPFLPHRDDDHADRRRRLPDVARRADHRARDRQRHLADHH